MSDRRSAPGPSSCSCPTKSSNECGLTRSASGFASSTAVVDLKRLVGGTAAAAALGVEDGAACDEEDEAFRLLEAGGGTALEVEARAELLPVDAPVDAPSGDWPQSESMWVLMKNVGTALAQIGLQATSQGQNKRRAR